MQRRDFLTKLPALGLATTAFTTSLIQGCTTSPTTNEVTNNAAGDINALRFVATMEGTAINTYIAALQRISTPSFIDAASLFRDHHIEHLSEANRILASLGQPPVRTTVIDSRFNTQMSETDAVNLAYVLEFEAANGYSNLISGTGTSANYTLTEVRRFFANTAPIEAAHFIALKSVLRNNGNPFIGINAARFDRLTL
jgi:rubrerythrin